MMVDLIGSKLARIGAVLGEDTSNIIAGSIKANLHERLLAGVRPCAPTAHACERSRDWVQVRRPS
jgi:hypothetical protein